MHSVKSKSKIAKILIKVELWCRGTDVRLIREKYFLFFCVVTQFEKIFRWPEWTTLYMYSRTNKAREKVLSSTFSLSISSLSLSILFFTLAPPSLRQRCFVISFADDDTTRRDTRRRICTIERVSRPLSRRTSRTLWRIRTRARSSGGKSFQRIAFNRRKTYNPLRLSSLWLAR